MSNLSQAAPPPFSLKSRPATRLARLHPDFVFWLSLAALNCLLFLPLYALNRDSASFLPPGSTDFTGPAATLQSLFVWRNNFDMFRLNVELPLLLTVWVFGGRLRRPPLRRAFVAIFVLMYVAALLYAVYEAVFLSLYQADPLFYNQYRLLLDNLGFVAEHVQLPAAAYALALAGIVAAVALVAGLLRALLAVPVERLSRSTRLALAVLAALALAAVLTQQSALASPKMAASSFVAKIGQNIDESIREWQAVQSTDPEALASAYDYGGYNLLATPDIYLIFVESYGSVLYKRPHFRPAYEQLLAELEQQLEHQGWRSSSALSISPTWGGGSWMAYTSALFGLHIDSHPQYLTLFDDFQTRDYPDLGFTLKQQGYRSQRLSALSVELGEEDWQAYKRFFGVDDWWQFRDLGYRGALYGWGPAPPDQYVLNFARESLIAGTKQPVFFFFITQNSHYPWVPLPPLVADWRTLNQEVSTHSPLALETMSLDGKRSNYLASIDYELRFLTEFILSQDDDAIFILIGDHQPQQVSRQSDGFDTPVHVIAKNADFVRSFQDFGFVDGLTVSSPVPAMRHEGLYSLLMRQLLAAYGAGDRPLPPYLPGGISTPTSP